MISIVDYGVGNLKSLTNAFKYIGTPARIVARPEEILQAERIVLPGVGAFGFAMQNINRLGFAEVLRDKAGQGTPILGICLGMQLLFSKSSEGQGCTGLGLIAGPVVRFEVKQKVPHMGWNEVTITRESALLHSLPDSRFAYFVHSYHCVPNNREAILAQCDYDGPFCSVVGQENIFGTQFHPEKSQEFGLQILKNFGKV